MIRALLILAVLAIGADALLNDGAVTKSVWHKLSSYEVTIEEEPEPAPR